MSWLAALGVTPWSQGNLLIWSQEEKALLSLPLASLDPGRPKLRVVCSEFLCPSSDALVLSFCY